MEKIFKIILIIATMLALTSCYEAPKTNYTRSALDFIVTEERIADGVYKLTIEQHEYLKFVNVSSNTDIEVLHSASCPATHEPGRVY